MAAPREDETNGQDPGGGGGGGGFGGGADGRSPREDTPPAPCAAFCGPRSCSTLPPSLSSPQQQQRQQQQQQSPVSTEPKRRRLWGLRGLVKMFRRRVRRRTGESVSPQPPPPTLRARSTSELAVDIQHSRGNGPYNQGLSVSHDSVFSPDASTDTHSHATPPSLAIATRGVNMAELKAVLRRRRGDDSGSGDDDPGLPRSPPTSPTTLDVLNHGLKSSSRATQSSCSDGSLLSMGSSENDEDSLGIGSHHSSKVSLLEGRHQVVEAEDVPKRKPRKSTRISYVSDSILDGRQSLVKDSKEGHPSDNEPLAGAVPLSHQAALHKISIRPRRTHGVPRSRRSTAAVAQIGQRSLPSTPEVNEDSNKNTSQTKHPPTPTIVSTREPSIIQPIKDEQNNSENREAEKKEKEEKKDEQPLFQRLIGSVRSGRRRSKGGSGDESRENSVSPMRRGSDQRTSREKRRDSSGSRFSMLGKSSPKAHPETSSESRPLPPPGRNREPSQEKLHKETTQSSPQAPRSASVEGRLESTTPTSQNIFRMSSYEERASRPLEGVRKVKSFREVHGHNINQQVVHSKVTTSQVSSYEKSDFKKTASSESLDEDAKTSSTRRKSSSGSIINLSSPQQSSTDFVSNSSFSGVFSRQQTHHNQYKVYKHKHPDNVLPKQAQSGPDVNSGPLSLDSSITLVAREPEDHMRKASSVSHMGYTVEASRTNIITKDIKATESTNISKMVESKSESRIICEEKSSDSVHLYKIRKDDDAKDKMSSEGILEGEVTRRQSLKKEPSIKRLSLEPNSTGLPEFMRIQLNRVENKSHSVIFATEQEKKAQFEAIANDSPSVQIDSNPAVVHGKSTDSSYGRSTDSSHRKSIDSSHAKSTDSLHIISKVDHPIVDDKVEKSSLKKSNSRKSLIRDISPSGSTLEKKDHDSGVEGSSPEPTIDRVILRKPLVSERAPVMERASSVTSQTVPSPTNDQPELFKVFARRSFKVKDSDKDKFQSLESDDGDNIEASSEVSEVMIVSTRAADNVPAVSSSSGTNSSIISMAQSGQSLQKSSINAISFNRKSVGNPTLSFCPPPVTNMTPSSSSPHSPKPDMTVLSSSSITPHSNTKTTSLTTNAHQSITITSSSTYTAATVTTSVTTSQYNKASVSAVPASVVRPENASLPEVHSTSEVTNVGGVSPVQQSGITSRIISSRKSLINNTMTIKDIVSGDEAENSQNSTPVTPPPGKSPRAGSGGIVWPPRSHQEDTQVSQVIPQADKPLVNRRLSSSSSNSIDLDSSKTPVKITEKIDVEISPLDIGAARRRFMSGGRDSQMTISAPSQSIAVSPTPPSPSPLCSSSPGSSNITTKLPGIEARNATPSITITVRSQSAITPETSDTISVTNTNTDLNSSTSSISSTGKAEHGSAVTQAAEDWRVLVRQRREGRLKQTKTPDSEDIIIETRPPVSRNSKVLEMANNFQKLQVA